MSKKQDDTGVPENLEAVDPLGEIRSCARDLWTADGSPDGKDWTHYWKASEELILGGKSSGVCSKRSGTIPTPGQARPLNPALLEIIQNEKNLLHSILAGAFRRTLNEHECLSLAHILDTHRISLVDGSQIEIKIADERAEALAALAGEYDSEFLSQHPSKNLLSIPLAKRTAYWANKLALVEKKDTPLSFADRNTVHRLLDDLRHEPRVDDLVFVAEPSELG